MIETFRLLQYEKDKEYYKNASPEDFQIWIIECIDRDKPEQEQNIRKEYISLKKPEKE